MLESLRRQSQNTFIWAALGIIVFVFIFFFGPQTAGFSPGSRVWAAKVGNHRIYDQQLTARFLLTRDRGQRLGDAEYAEVRRSIAYDLSLVRVLADRARENGLEVTDAELRCYIVNWHRGYRVDGEQICRDFPEDYATRYQNLDFAQYSDRDGRLADTYRQAVRGAFQMAIDEYEDAKRDELLALRYLDLLAASLPVTPEQVQATWQRRNESVDLEFVRIDPVLARGAPVTDDDVAALQATDPAAIQTRYDANAAEYAEPRQVRFRSIFVRRPDASAPDYAAAEAKYLGLLDRARSGEDFEALVAEATEAANERDSGGDMGMREVENLSEQLVDALGAMNVGDIAGVEFTTFWRVVKLEEDIAARQRPLEEVSAEIARALLEERALASARAEVSARAARVLAIAQGGASLTDALPQEALEHAAATGETPVAPEGAEPAELLAPPASPFRVETTGLFARERAGETLGEGATAFRLPPPPPDQIPGIGSAPEIARIAFSLTTEAPLHPSLVEHDGAFYVVRLAQRNEPAAEIPDTARREIENELRTELADSLIAREATRARMLVHSARAQYGPVIASILDEAVTSGAIRLNESVFRVDPTADLTE